MRYLMVIFILLAIVGCTNSSKDKIPPVTQGQVDLQRYQGDWFELARLPMFFQRNCLHSVANYQLSNDGKVAVYNRCRTEKGEWQGIQGYAEPVADGVTDKLWVRFDNMANRFTGGRIKSPYWILYVDADYQTAIVGSPDYKYLWFLSRTREVSAETRERLLDIARQRGYQLDELIWAPQPWPNEMPPQPPLSPETELKH